MGSIFLEQKRHGHHRARAGRHIPKTPTYDPEHVVAGEGKKKEETEKEKDTDRALVTRVE